MSSEMWAFLSPGTLREGISLVRAVWPAVEKGQRILLWLAAGRRVGGSQSNYPGSTVCSNTKVPYWGAGCSEPYTSLPHIQFIYDTLRTGTQDSESRHRMSPWGWCQGCTEASKLEFKKF
jgi:hypothetical protein